MKEGLNKEDNRGHQDEEKDHHNEMYYSSTDDDNDNNLSSEKSSVRKRGKRDIYKVQRNRDYGNMVDEIMSYYFKLGDVFR